MIKIKAPKLTVLMSVFNNENTVRRAVKSILEQSFKDFVFLIIDDSSTDNSLNIIRSFNDRRIRVISNKNNIGLTRSLNTGLKLSSGKYIARLDADDISLPKRLEKQIDFLEKNPDFVLCGTGYHIIDKEGNIIKDIVYDTYSEKLYYDLNFQNIIAHSSVVFKKKEILSSGGYSIKYRYSQDFDLWQRLTRIGKAWIMPEILMKWNDSKDNISSKNSDQQNKAALEIFKDNLKRLGIDNKKINDISCFHNFYSKNYLGCSPSSIRRALYSLKGINALIIKKAPSFYDKNILINVSYKTTVDLLSSIYKYSSDKNMVLKYIFKNLYDLRLDLEVFKKVIRA